MKINPAVPCGFVLDLLLADPAWMPHPVVYMGKAITALEDLLRPRLPKTPKGELLGGTILAAALPAGTFAVASGACALAYKLHPKLGFALETVWCWQALALKGLAQESAAVQRELEKGGLPAARKAVGRIVGRDTGNLTTEGVTKAAVETVAENFSDGVAAPLFYMLLGGAPLALTYKAVNTMDSMVGYKNDRYLYFGRAAAKLDDLANMAPSRLAALCWVGAAFLTGQDGKSAWWERLSSPDRTAKTPGGSGGGTAGTTPAPTPPRPSPPVPEPCTYSWRGPPPTSAGWWTSPPSATRIGLWSRRTSAGPTRCCTGRQVWPWGPDCWPGR